MELHGECCGPGRLIDVENEIEAKALQHQPTLRLPKVHMVQQGVIFEQRSCVFERYPADRTLGILAFEGGKDGGGSKNVAHRVQIDDEHSCPHGLLQGTLLQATHTGKTRFVAVKESAIWNWNRHRLHVIIARVSPSRLKRIA